MKNFWLALVGITLVTPAFALVDYSDDDEAPATKKSVKSLKSSPAKKSRGAPSTVEFNTKYDSIKINTNDGGTTGGLDIIKSKIFAQTPYNVFFDVSYWQASSPDLYATKSSQAGNPEAKIGFNWLKLGNDADAAKVDIYAGYMMKANNSLVGSSRNDQIFGVHTSKRFADFAMGFGGEYRKTSNPANSNDLIIGDVTRMHAALGWVATPDIRMSLEADMYKVRAGEGDELRIMQNDISFSTLTPKLHLGLSQFVELELGTAIRTRKPVVPNNQNLLDAKLSDFAGVYGSSMFAGLNISI